MSQQPRKNDRPDPRPTAGGPEETSLDPAEWGEFRALCHEMLDEALAHLETARTRPVWRPVPDEAKAALAEPLPRAPQGASRVCADFRRLVLPYATGNTHPRFFGWVHGSGTAGGMLAELLAAAMNANLGGRDHGPVYVERQVLEWCRQLFGFPEGAGGLLVSGTSMATLIALTVARNYMAGHDVRRHGLGPGSGSLVAYASAEAHGSIAKALEILGLGSGALRSVPVDGAYRMDLAALARAIEDDTAAGRVPFCVIATAGTVNTGAIDDLAGVAAICRARDLWLHVDGAFGALAVLSETLKPRLAGIARADSLAFDFHKWLHVPYDAGCVLVRRGELQRWTFSSRQDYLAGMARGLAGGEPWFCEYGPELSRGFRALKVWFTLKEHGLARLGRKIDDNCRQAAALAGRVRDHPNLELLAPAPLNIVCFRFTWPGATPELLDRVNGGIVTELQARGIAAPSTTRLEGALAIRVNITNHRTRRSDVAVLIEAILALGAEFAAAAAAPARRVALPCRA
jgi:glutamate/tyrosine decarboxylase-like PLP-dependent enzyme